MDGQDQSLSPTKSSNGVGQDSRNCGGGLPQGPTGRRQVPEVEVAELLSFVFSTDSFSDIGWKIGVQKQYFTYFR